MKRTSHIIGLAKTSKAKSVWALRSNALPLDVQGNSCNPYCYYEPNVNRKQRHSGASQS
ncbi:MAG: hypothetical protein K9I84_05570 [Leadbetterella sp.]|nr:hypothetical protein [Leadbetterella sp.]